MKKNKNIVMIILLLVGVAVGMVVEDKFNFIKPKTA